MVSRPDTSDDFESELKTRLEEALYFSEVFSKSENDRFARVTEHLLQALEKVRG